MAALVPLWRADADAARRLHGLSESLAGADVLRAVEQVRQQRQGPAPLPAWLQALAGFAWCPAQDVEPPLCQHADEGAVLDQLVARFDGSSGPVAVFADAEGLCRQLRLRLLLAGRAPSFAQDWAARLVDGQSWQPPGLAADPDAPGAVLALATGEPAFDPQGQAADDPRRAVAQARALCRLQEAGWL